MKAKRIEKIPISQIRILNPRTRNAVTFRGIIHNISAVGLKKPVTVFRREISSDGTQYDLVYGQGRMEAIAALGGKVVPAITTDAPLKDRYLMSLVENIARKRPPLSDLVREVRSLIDGIVNLLRRGEDRLVEQVEAGTVPLSIAIKIATAGSKEVQRAMSEAYEKGELRGAKLVTVQRLIARRSVRHRQSGPAERPSTKDLARTYEQHTLKQRAMVHRAAIVRERLALLRAALKRLFVDQEFVRLLRSEGLDTIPEQVTSHIQ
jgi:ParB family chromosome partitioning protein